MCPAVQRMCAYLQSLESSKRNTSKLLHVCEFLAGLFFNRRNLGSISLQGMNSPNYYMQLGVS